MKTYDLVFRKIYSKELVADIHDLVEKHIHVSHVNTEIQKDLGNISAKSNKLVAQSRTNISINELVCVDRGYSQVV